MNYRTKICANCGADDGLHHYETEQCPKNGIEEWREGRKQEWEETTFEDSGIKKLHDAAPDMLEALMFMATQMQGQTTVIMINAIQKATGMNYNEVSEYIKKAKGE